MTRRWKTVALTLALAVWVAPAEAQYDNFGQFLVMRCDSTCGTEEGIQNPTGREMYTMRIVYDVAGEFAGCDGQVIPPHANDSDTDGDPDTDINCTVETLSGDTLCQQEVLAVPATGAPGAGNFNPRFGVIYNYEKGNHGLASDPSTFELDESEGDTPVTDCVCAELCEDSQDEDLLDGFGFNCDPC